MKAGVAPQLLRSCLVLLIAERPATGPELVGRVRALFPGAVDDLEVINRVLGNLESRGSITPCAELNERGPQPPLYQLTPDGWAWLTGWAEDLRRRHAATPPRRPAAGAPDLAAPSAPAEELRGSAQPRHRTGVRHPRKTGSTAGQD